MLGVFNKKVGSVDTKGVPGTFVIGVSFIIIAYFLHPLVESAYHRVRAYRAWRALEKREAVEVTNYPMLVETLGGRGKWDTARIITVLLAVFSLVSWGLELSVGLAIHGGMADTLSRPPPVTIKPIDGVKQMNVWEVKPPDNITHDGKWKEDFNMYDDEALSMYVIKSNETCRKGRVKGSIPVASWSGKPEDSRVPLHHYDKSTSTAAVMSLECDEGQNETNLIRLRDADHCWGTVVTCDNGPTTYNVNATDNDTNAPPTLIMNRYGGDTFLIVEESSNYPSFLYSVWKNGTQHDGFIELTHVFHIAATVRLAEAVVTAIVQGRATGFHCFSLVRENSETEAEVNSERAKPFGEDPDDSKVDIASLETIECGLEFDLKAFLCLVFLALLAIVGLTWSFCLRSSIGMNVYDRDELIRAVSVSAATNRSTAPSAIRIFVRKEDSGSLSVVISDAGDAETGCGRIFRRRGSVVDTIEPAPNAADVAQFNNGYGGAAIPVGRPTAWLEGVRTGLGRPLPGRDGNYCYPTSIALSASSVPSSACSLVPTPVHSRSPLARVQRDGLGLTRARGASVLFDGSFSPSDSEEDETGGMQAGRRSNVKSDDARSARVVASGDSKDASCMLQGVHPLDMAGPSLSDRNVGTKVLRFSSRMKTPQANGGASRMPPFLRDFSVGPPQLGPLSRGSGGGTKDQTFVIRLGNTGGVNNEDSPSSLKEVESNKR